MKKNRARKAALFSVIILLFSCVNCAKKITFHRFVDTLTESNIVRSPLKDLNNKFETYGQEWRTEDMTPLLLGEKKFLGISSSYPILGTDDTAAPDHMIVFENEREIAYLRGQQQEGTGWNWIKGEKIIQINKNIYHHQKFDGKTVYSTDLNLASGFVMFTIKVINDHPGSFSPTMIVLLDKEIIGRKKISKNTNYVFSTNVQIGTHRLRLAFQENAEYARTNESDIAIHIVNVKVKCQRDIILIHSPDKSNIRDSLFKAVYKKEPTELKEINKNKRLVIPNSLQREFYYLYFFNSNKTIISNDLGIGDNPYNIKKKIVYGDTTLNALFAPAPSTYKFDVKIPNNGFLDFGYGIYAPVRKNADLDPVRFQIVAETNGKKDVLFQEEIHPQKNSYTQRKIKLESLEGKQTKIFLNTSYKNEKNQNICYAYWNNPIIYRELEEKEKKINMILISLDSLRSDHLGCYGYQKEISPNIDKLSEDSVVFTNCFSQASQTLVSHMSMLTSLFPVHHQVYSFLKTNPYLTTIADILRINQYFTGAFTGGGQVSARLGFSKGFDFYNEARENLRQKDSPPELFKKAMNWIKKNQEKNFFLFLHTYEIHDPYAPPEEYAEKFLSSEAKWKDVYMFELIGRSKQKFRSFSEKEKENIIALYDGEIRYTDESLIRPLIHELKRLDLYDRTLIILTSDHGQEFYEHGGWLHTHSVYNELIKVPLLIKFPESEFKGTKVDYFVRTVDIVPTILEEASIDYAKFDFDGKSLFSLIKGQEKENRIFYSEVRGYSNIYPPQTASNRGGLKIIFNELGNEPKNHFDPPPPTKQEIELFDLEIDPEELNNIAEEQKETARILLDRIIEYIQQLGKGQNNLENTDIDDDLREKLKALGYIR